MHLRWFLLILLLPLRLSPSPPSPPPSDSPPLRPHARSSLEAAIAVLEYRASWSGGDPQAPNRAHGLRATRVVRSGALAEIPAGELHSEASRVEIRRPGLCPLSCSVGTSGTCGAIS